MRAITALLTLSAFAFASHAVAQAFPGRPITITLPFPPGSNVDLAFRAVSAEAGRALGQPLVFENRPGANTRLGINAVRKAPGDGYLLTIAIDGVLVSQPLVDPDFKLEAGKDYVPVAFAFEFPLVLAANASLPFRDAKGLIAYAKANPGKLNFAVTTASSSHFVSERFRQASGIEATMVPYKGAQQSITDLLAGRVQLLFAGTVLGPFFENGKLTGIATTGTQRWKAFPDLPTLQESGVPVSTTTWFGVVAPPGTPADIVAKLNGAFNSALRRPEIAKQLDRYGMSTARAGSPAQFAAFIREEIDAWAPVIRKAGIRME